MYFFFLFDIIFIVIIMKKINIQFFIIIIGIMLSISGFLGVRKYFYKNYFNNKEKYNLAYNDVKLKSNSYNVVKKVEEELIIPEAETTTTTKTTTTLVTTTKIQETEKVEPVINNEVINDDGSIVYDGLTLTLLTEKLNKNLSSTLTNTGIYFANYTKKTGLDPYLAVAIVLHETGCKWTCSSLVRNNYNIGGLKSGGKFIKYNTLEEGIDGYLNILFNNYYSKGLTTAELMQSKYAPSSTTWTDKINWYINNIKES